MMGHPAGVRAWALSHRREKWRRRAEVAAVVLILAIACVLPCIGDSIAF